MNARGEPSPIVHGWSEMNMAVDLTPELNLADLTNFAKDQWAFAFDQKGNEFSNKSYAVATVEKDLPKAFSVVLHDTLERAKHREFEPKRQQWLQKSSSQKGTGWEGYKGIGQGKGKGHSGKGSYQRQTKGTGHWGSNQPYWQQSQNDQYYWNQRHQQYQRSYPGGSAGYGGSSSSSHGGYHSKGRSERPREEAVEWHGAMYTKYTYSDGRALIASKDKAQMEVEVASLLRGIDATQKHVEELEVAKASHSTQIQDVTAKLREFTDKVSPETGKLREQLIAALREEEFCIVRLEVLRQVQVQDIKFLAHLRQALA
eukprot:symbB.v1.2.040094.t1/scaffold6983.1/size14050/2